MGLYTSLERMDKKTVFWYTAIIIMSLLFFRSKSIGLNVFLALIVAVVIILYIHEKDTVNNILENEQRQTKLDSIQPPSTQLEKQDDLIDFLFSIQDFYHHNPQAYEEMVDNIDAFLKLYEIIMLGTKSCDDYYAIAQNKKNNAINALHSMIYNLPNNKIVTDKLNRAHKRLETILLNYQNDLYDECHHDLIRRGYDMHRHPPEKGPKARNHYEDEEKKYSYQLY